MPFALALGADVILASGIGVIYCWLRRRGIRKTGS